jgi:hypothetical protein
MDAQWYVLLANNQQEGPLTSEAVRELVKQGRATARNNAWRQGMDGWKPLGQIDAFADLAGSGGEPWDAVAATFERGKRGALRTMKTARIRMNIAKEKKERERLCAQLGEAVFMSREELALPEALTRQAEAIAKCDAGIAALEQQLTDVGEDRETPPDNPAGT